MQAILRGILLGLVGLGLVCQPAAAGALKTDVSKALVPPDQIVSGGPPPDGIPAIDRPVFVPTGAADAWLKPTEPVLALQVNGDARAYPVQILIWHEIVNDTVGGRPVAVSYCPLCNSGLVFDRVVDGRTLDFGTSGKLYRSDLLMYDRQTHSLWAQIEGRAVVGERAGTRLAPIPANTIAYEDFKAAYPAGRVLSRDTGHARSYGTNPYGSYERLVIFYRSGAVSALDDSEIARSRDVGATGVFSPAVDGKVLSFERVPEGFRDRETGSVWTLLGHAVKGPLAGRRLRAIPHVDAFWFAWAAFNPTA